jgi:O-antigen/teichoic acid export membrane protein
VLAVFLPVITVYAVALAASRGFGTIKPLVVVDNVLVPGGRTVAALAALAAGLGGIALAYSTGAALAVGLLVVLLWTYRLLARVERRESGGPGSGPRTATGALFGEFWRFAGPRGIASVFSTLQSNISVLLLGALATIGAGAVGVFAAATRFMKFGTLARIAIFFVISPQISAFLARGDRERAQAVYEVSTWWVMIGSWPVYIVLAVWSPFLMKLFGKGFTSGATALTILSLAMLVSMAAGPVQVVLLMDGRAMWNLVNTAVALAVVVVLSFALIPKYGVDGAAIATAASIVVNNVAAFVQVSVLMKLRTTGTGFWITAATSLLAFGVVGLGFRLVVGMTFATFVVFAVVSTGLYLLILLRFRDILELKVLWDTVVRRGRGDDGGRRGRGPAPDPGAGSAPVARYRGRHRGSPRAAVDARDLRPAVDEGTGEALETGAGAAIEADLELDAEDQQGL